MKAFVTILAGAVAGGAVGTGVRFGVTELVLALGGSYISSLLVVNLLGALALGWFAGRARLSSGTPQWLVAFIGVGVLGSFTTFSSFTVETVERVSAGEPLVALMFSFVSLAAGIALAGVGRRFASR